MFFSIPCHHLLNPCSRISISIYSGVARSGSSAICSRCCCSIAAFSCVVSCAIYLFFASRMLGGSFASFVLRLIRVEYMKLKLNYVPDWKKNGGSSGGKQDDTWNKNYQVTARSGLNMRKEPNGAIITTIPYGKTVKGDGTSKNGWHHVKYGNNTGYCYSVWLKET